jgi:hypothetical protein
MTAIFISLLSLEPSPTAPVRNYSSSCTRLSRRGRDDILLCDLAHAWYQDRLDPDWRPHTLEQNQAILSGLGLTAEFWNLV